MIKRYLAGLTFIILLLSIFVTCSSATIDITNAKGLHSFNFESKGSSFISEGCFLVRNTGIESTTVSIELIQGLNAVDMNDNQPRIHPSISETVFFYPLQHLDWITLKETEVTIESGESYTFYYDINIPKAEAWKSIDGNLEKGFLNYIQISEKSSDVISVRYNYKMFIVFSGEYISSPFNNLLLILAISSIASFIMFLYLKFKRKKTKASLLPVLIALLLTIVPLVNALTLTGTFYAYSGQMDPPSSFTATAYNTSTINLSWVKNSSADKTYVMRNETGYPNYPLSISNGTNIYNGTDSKYNDTSLVMGVSYYYTAWSWNDTIHNYSTTNSTATATTNFTIQISSPYPANSSTELSRPPANVSIWANGTGLTIYITYVNMSPLTPITEICASFSGVSTGRYAFTSFSSNGTNWIWGNTTYTWWVNATDGNNHWDNATYHYTTDSVATGANARLDITNDDVVNVLDLSSIWAHRSALLDYDRMYDVNSDNTVNVIDVSITWIGRS